jgi:hypothetical protein
MAAFQCRANRQRPIRISIHEPYPSASPPNALLPQQIGRLTGPYKRSQRDKLLGTDGSSPPKVSDPQGKPEPPETRRNTVARRTDQDRTWDILANDPRILSCARRRRTTFGCVPERNGERPSEVDRQLLDLEQLNLEDRLSIGRDVWRETFLAVGELRWDDQLALPRVLVALLQNTSTNISGATIATIHTNKNLNRNVGFDSRSFFTPTVLATNDGGDGVKERSSPLSQGGTRPLGRTLASSRRTSGR